MAGGYAKPPSEKQLGFLKSLVAKSGVPEGFDYPPKTSQEASALINALKNPQVAPREGQTIESVFDEYKNIFGIEHEYAKHKDVPDFFGEQKQDYIRDINSTIQRFDKFARIIRTYYGKGITKSGSEFLAFGGVGQKIKQCHLIVLLVVGLLMKIFYKSSIIEANLLLDQLLMLIKLQRAGKVI